MTCYEEVPSIAVRRNPQNHRVQERWLLRPAGTGNLSGKIDLAMVFAVIMITNILLERTRATSMRSFRTVGVQQSAWPCSSSAAGVSRG